MGKVIGTIAKVVGIAALVVTGVGAAVGLSVGATLGAAVSGGLASTIGGISMSTFLIGAAGLSALATALGPKPVAPSAATTDRLNATLNPREYRKIWFGRTAGNTDVRYQEFTGANQEYLNSIIVAASHAVQSIDEIWFDDALAWSATGGVASKYAGYLEVTTRTEGTAANAFTITGSTSWVAAQSRLVGCAYVWLRYKLTGNGKNAESPFSSNVPSRVTIRGRGAKLYDPRQDSTVGGSGPQRANDQSTWAWTSDDVGRNPALQLLWYFLGWRITHAQTGVKKLAVGLGLPMARLLIPAFIAAANLCDEPVVRAIGGTEPRYRADGVFSEGDDPDTVIGNLKAAMNGEVRDAGGQLALDILHNDLGTDVIDLGPGDVVGAFTWVPAPPIDQIFNVVRGKYVDPSDASLYQMVDYPEVPLTGGSPDGIERASTLDLSMVQSPSQAQRLAKAYLQRAQYPGTFSADFLASAWRVQVGRIVRFTFPALGFDAKLFRVVEHGIRFDGTCPMVLREESATIYAWDAEERPAVVPAPAVTYDPLNDPIVRGIGDVSTEVADAISIATSKGRLTIGGTLPAAADSNVGDTHIGDDGTFYERVGASIVLGGSIIVLGGMRPSLPWKLAASQPLRDTIARANAAYTDANDAIDKLAGLADDGILSANEKITKLIPESARLADKWSALSAIAASLGVSTASASAARAAWLGFLDGLAPAWNDTTQDTAVSRSAYNAARDGYDAALYDLDRSIKDAVKVLANNAQATADSAQATALAAQSAASSAASNATSALTQIGTIVSDGYLDRGEKPDAVRAWQAISDEQSTIDTRATTFGITTEKTAYDNAVSALASYLGSLSPAWNNYALDTAIVRATYIGKWNDVYYARQVLLDKIAGVASQRAGWSYVSDIPGILTDGRIAAGLNSDGSVATNKVSTTAIIASSVTDVAQFYNGSAVSGVGIGSENALIDVWVDMPIAGDIIVISTAKQSFTAGSAPWVFRAYIGGTNVAEAGGSAYQDAVPLTGKKSVSAGSVFVTLRWAATSGINVAAGAASLIILRRYR